MDYITIKCARFNSVSGPGNLPYGIAVECTDGVLTIDGHPLCADHSQNDYDFFARNDDSHGLERGKLTQTLRKKLEKRDKQHENRWYNVWTDLFCKKYKRVEHTDYWLWNHEFFNAEIPDLRHIAALTGAKGGA